VAEYQSTAESSNGKKIKKPKNANTLNEDGGQTYSSDDEEEG